MQSRKQRGNSDTPHLCACNRVRVLCSKPDEQRGENVKDEPLWIVAKFGKCYKCKAKLTSKQSYYLPMTKAAFCETCGKVYEQRVLAQENKNLHP